MDYTYYELCILDRVYELGMLDTVTWGTYP